MKALKEYLVNRKIKARSNRFNFSESDLTGRQIHWKDVTEGMYIKLLIQGNPARAVYAIAKGPAYLGGSPVLWTYFKRNAVGKCTDSTGDGQVNSDNTMGTDANIMHSKQPNELFIMDRNDYNFFLSEMKKKNIDIPDEFLLA